ncbi:hypothetical protein F5Y09DRAFT_347935 [Xylaria sp. FL1042]|nr:hypothetical protein F5Y09DRAFT_347935 [Xylaria sp. FL1042]
MADDVSSRVGAHMEDFQGQQLDINDRNPYKRRKYCGTNLLELTLDNIDVQLGPEGIRDTWGHIIFQLLEMGLPLNPSYESVGNLLHALSELGDIEKLETLFRYGVDTNLPVKTDEGSGHCGSAIHIAAARTQVESVKLLIRHGADVAAERLCFHSSRKGALNRTPVQAALEWRHNVKNWDGFWEICELLIEAGAGQDDCQSLLQFASERENIPFAKRLLDRGIRLSEMPVTQSPEIVKLLVEHGTAIDSPPGQGPLAPVGGQLLSTSGIIDCGFSRFSRTPVDEQKRFLDFLLQKGYVSLNEPCRCYCGKGWTNLLQGLVARGLHRLVEHALARGADPLCLGCPDTAIKSIGSNKAA